MLSKPENGELLNIYLGVLLSTINSVLIREDERNTVIDVLY